MLFPYFLIQKNLVSGLPFHLPQVAPFAAKFRDPRISNMLKVRAKTLIEYKQVPEGAGRPWPLHVGCHIATNGSQLKLLIALTCY